MKFLSSIAILLVMVSTAATCRASTSFSYTSSSGITYDFTSEKMTASLNGREVLSGIWIAGGGDDAFNVDGDRIEFGDPTGVSLARVASNSVRITQTYRAFKTVSTWKLSGEDIHLTFVVSNITSAKPVQMLEFSGVTVNFSRAADGFLPSWHWTYLRHIGRNILHPSLWAPVGCVWAADDEFGFSAYTKTRLDRAKLIHAEFEADGVIPAQCKLQYFVPESLEQGQTKTFDLHLRISRDLTWQHLLSPYRDAFRAALPAVKYKHQEKPFAFFSAVDATWARQDNPFGFGDDNGTSIWRRLDKPEGAKAFLATADKFKVAGAQGCIFWAMNGLDGRGCMYRPDFDVFRPQIAANLPILAKGFADRGLLFGLCARPGEAVDRTDWDRDGTFRLSASSSDQMDRLVARFKHAREMGFNCFYLDSFGADYNDLLIMRRIRPELGDMPTYAEFASDLMLAESGRYLEHRDGKFMWITPQLLSVQRWLVDGAGFVVKNVDNAQIDFKSTLREDWTWGRN